MELTAQIESILFVASKPLKIKQIAKACEKTESEVSEALENLKIKYNHENSGIQIVFNDDNFEMTTNSENFSLLDSFIKTEISEELTKAQLETLTIIAYQNEVTRPEIEEIRGVNCAVIIRNLLIRGLIQEKDSSEKLTPIYSLSLEALKGLGLNSIEDLPKYQEFHNHDYVKEKIANSDTEDYE
ncbi:MAG: SMC-Scp complex subunit ScpB [Patescibacteria group bacterium]